MERGNGNDVDNARAGDVRAFERLYRAHLPRVFSLLVRMTADRALAEEHTQTAFIRAWEQLGNFRGEAAFSTWLHRLAVNVALQHRRAAGRSPLRLVDDATVEPKDRTPPHPGERMDLERALAELPEGARQVFVLHDVEGWPHEAIGEALQISVGTSKSQLHRARSLLREAMPR